MKRIILFGLMSILFDYYSHAQVKDISVTVAPTAEYTWWDNETILKDGPLVGGRIGFGFGQYFEIRGSYMKSMDLKAALEDVNWKYTDNLAKDLENTKVDVTRWGGELKANIGLSGWFAPYVTVGTGIQTFKYKREKQKLDEYKEEQIYASLGLGAKFNLSDRLVLALEGRNTTFNLNEGNAYLDPTKLKVDGDDKRMYNWSALASLEFYLGGRNPQEMTELDRAYRNSLKGGGLKGFKFSVEPGMMYINFDDESSFSDSYLLGGAAGFDITNYVGLRGFYYQSTKDREFKFEVNSDMKVYGGNVIARLNENTGVTPYLSLGGGYINVSDYTNDEGVVVNDGTGFAMGGLGIEIPLSRYLLAYASANYMMTSDKDAKKLSDPSELRSNVAYRAGLRFQIGGRTEDPKNILNRYNSKHQEEISDLRREYEKRIEKLNKELEKAYEEEDVDKAVMILEERKRNEKELEYVEGERKAVVKDEKEMVKMSREEFENLVNEVIRKIDEEKVPQGYEYERIQQLENALLEVNANAPKDTVVNVAPVNDKVLEELKKLNEQVNRNTDLITKSMMTMPAAQVPTNNTIIEPQSATSEVSKTISRSEDGQTIEVVEKRANNLFDEGFSVFTGPSFGNGFAWNLGLRSYHKVGSFENWKFMPEIFFGLAGESSFGLSGNMIYTFDNVRRGKFMNPYLGLGLGVFKQDESDFGANFIVGTEIDVLNGKLFIDYSARNFFKNNQFAVGYKFTF